MSKSAHIIILNYNGQELLPKCMPSILEAAQVAKSPVKVTVLDNLSSDESQSIVEAQFPTATFVSAKENKVLSSYNDYVRNVEEDVVILLNNDIRVEKNFIDPLMSKFESNSNLFLVAPKVLTFDGKGVDAARTVGAFRFGLFWTSARYPGYENEINTTSETFSSGIGAFDKNKFLELEGYDERYLPGIFEDVDLCYRAKRKGYDLVYNPESVIYHVGQASFKDKYGDEKIQVLAARNNFLFLWKNFRGFFFWLQHIFWVPFRILFSLLKGKTYLLKGFIQAIQKGGAR